MTTRNVDSIADECDRLHRENGKLRARLRAAPAPVQAAKRQHSQHRHGDLALPCHRLQLAADGGIN
jgi:hypothetical protein